jgi:hypothetical protein
MNSKRVVHYVETLRGPIVGQSAIVVPIDHTSSKVSNTQSVLTSTVLKVHGDLGFETLNSEYRKSSGEER